MLLVVGAAIAVLTFMPESSGEPKEKRPSAQSKMADNVSKFYMAARSSSRDPLQERFGEYVVAFEISEKPIQEQLQNLQGLAAPNVESWYGEFKQRAFAQGSTLFKEADAHIMENGSHLIWALNQDFMVRNRFVSENTIPGMLSEIASAVNANFERNVEVYYCEKNNAFIITDKPDEYLDRACRLFVDNY